MANKSQLFFSTYALLVLLAVIIAISSTGISTILADDISEGFESSLDGRYVYHGDNATFTHISDPGQSHEGNRSLQIVSNNSAPGWKEIPELTRWMTPIQAYRVNPGDTIKAEVYMRGENIKDQADLSLTFFKEAENGDWSSAWVRSAISSTKLSGTTGWTKVSVEYESPAAAVYVRPEFRLFDTGTLYIDTFSFEIVGEQASPDAVNQNIVVHETIGNEGPEFGAQVVLGQELFIWVNPDCKNSLLADGQDVTSVAWPYLADNFTQLQTYSISCDEVRFFDGDTSSIRAGGTPSVPGNSGPGEIIGPSPPPGGTNPDPVATEDGEFNTSVVPHDELITLLYHGIDRHHEQQLFTVDCGHSHFANDDPIVFPGQHGVSHEHEFFGDTQVNGSTTTQDILNNPGNTCSAEADRSAYWTPTAYQDGKQLIASSNKFYYKAGPVDPSLIVDMPVGLQMIAGNANATGPQSPQVTFFFASEGKGKLTSPMTQSTRGRDSMFTITETENGVHANVHFPQCWDGENLWLPNSSHMAYPINTGKRYHECPASHPKPIIRLVHNLGYKDATGGPGFSLSSGEWYTMHADFINGWKPEVLKKLTDVCVRGKRYCGIVETTDQCEEIKLETDPINGCVTILPDEPEAILSGATTFPECHVVQGKCL